MKKIQNYINGQFLSAFSKKYKNNPYVNYQWLNSSKLKCIKNFIGKDWEKLEIEMITTTNIKRNFSIIEDFMPHIISILFNNPNDILRIKNSKKILRSVKWIYKKKKR